MGTAVALTVLFGPIGLIKHGKNVEVKASRPCEAVARTSLDRLHNGLRRDHRRSSATQFSAPSARQGEHACISSSLESEKMGPLLEPSDRGWHGPAGDHRFAAGPGRRSRCKKKMCEIGVGFSFAALSVFRLRRAEAASAVWIPHWHSEPFESQGARAAKRWT